MVPGTFFLDKFLSRNLVPGTIFPRKGLEGREAATPQAGPERGSAEPRKARSPHRGDAPKLLKQTF
jgi:hypothetical protein